MTSEQVLSCYLVRMRKKRRVMHIEVQDVRSGEILRFSSMEDFLAELAQLLKASGIAREPQEVQQ